jgi:hypothetical protein
MASWNWTSLPLSRGLSSMCHMAAEDPAEVVVSANCMVDAPNGSRYTATGMAQAS